MRRRPLSEPNTMKQKHLWVDGVERAVTDQTHSAVVDFFERQREDDGADDPLPLTLIEDDGMLDEVVVDSAKISL